MLDKQVLIQFMERRIETLQKLINLENNSADSVILKANLNETKRWKEDIINGNYDAQIW